MFYVFLSIREVCKNKNEMFGKGSIEVGEDTFLILIFFSLKNFFFKLIWEILPLLFEVLSSDDCFLFIYFKWKKNNGLFIREHNNKYSCTMCGDGDAELIGCLHQRLFGLNCFSI